MDDYIESILRDAQAYEEAELQKTELHRAAGRGDLGAVLAMLSRAERLEAGGDGVSPLALQERDDKGLIPLHYAALALQACCLPRARMARRAKNGCVQVIKALLAAERGPAAERDEEGHRVRVCAQAQTGERNSLSPQVSATDNGGRTALHHAASQGHHRAIEALLEAGSDSARQDAEGNTALHLAAHSGWGKAVLVLLRHAGRSLAVHGANAKGQTPLHCAVEYGDAGVVQALVDHLLQPRPGPETDQEQYGEKREEREKGLRSRRAATVAAFVDARDDSGRTPLMYCGDPDGNCLQILLGAGASLTDVDSEGLTVLHHAARKCGSGIMSMLVEAVRRMMRKSGGTVPEIWGAVALAVDKKGMTPLHHSATQGDEPGVEEQLRLLSCICPRVSYPPPARQAPARQAPARQAPARQAPAARAECAPEASTERTEPAVHPVALADARGWTPLHHAAANACHPRTVELLLEAGADTLAMDEEGMTPLHRAAARGTSNVIDPLLQAGKRALGVRDAAGRTPSQLAAKNKHWHFIRDIRDFFRPASP